MYKTTIYINDSRLATGEKNVLLYFYFLLLYRRTRAKKKPVEDARKKNIIWLYMHINSSEFFFIWMHHCCMRAFDFQSRYIRCNTVWHMFITLLRCKMLIKKQYSADEEEEKKNKKKYIGSYKIRQTLKYGVVKWKTKWERRDKTYICIFIITQPHTIW